MSCSNSAPFSFETQMFFNNDCFSCGDNDCGANIQNARCVIYTGPNLSCSGINTNDSLETALQKIDTQICSAIGDYSNYQFNCLETFWGSSITQESTFVDAITSYACTNRDDYDTFVNTTFVAYEAAVDTRFIAIELPAITCTSASVTDTDTLQVVLAKYCTKFGEIDTSLDISSVVWNNCFSVPSIPTNIADGFILVLDQICQVQAAGATLPTFNNIGSCLPSPGSSDSLASTVDKIKTRLCETGSIDMTALTSSCVSIPTEVTDLQTLLQTIINTLDGFTQNAPSYSGDFSVSPNGGPCDGITISLATPSSQDRFVASTAIDSSPGTLQSKVTAGTGITLDFLSTPGQMIISSSGSDSYTVKADTADTTPDFLDQKLEGASNNGVSIGISYNGGTEKVTITPTVDLSTLVGNILTFIGGDGDSLAALCSLLAPCLGVSCQTYSVANATGDVATVTYTDCTTNTPISITVSDGGTVEVCAKYGTVTAAGCTITSLGNCTGGGGGGGTTVTISNDLPNMSIDSVTGLSGFTLSSPVAVGGSETGTHNTFSGTVNVVVSGTPLSPGNMAVEVNGIVTQCVDVTVATTVGLTISANSTDTIHISLNNSPCT